MATKNLAPLSYTAAWLWNCKISWKEHAILVNKPLSNHSVFRQVVLKASLNILRANVRYEKPTTSNNAGNITQERPVKAIRLQAAQVVFK